jgi:hypothetical protein
MARRVLRHVAMLGVVALVATGCGLVLGIESSYEPRALLGVDDAGGLDVTPSPDDASCQSTGTCKECVPGAFRCVDAELQGCDRGRFVPLMTCSSAALCSATGGNCAGLYCTVGQHRCSADRLERCNATQTQFELVEVCGVGLCDAVAKRCNVCLPSSRSCFDVVTLAQCSADGLTMTKVACALPTSRCANRPAGSACVECTVDTQCASADPCRKPSCANGTCTTVPDATKNGVEVEAQQQGSCSHMVCRNGVSVKENLAVDTFCDKDQMNNPYYCDVNGNCIIHPFN